MPVKDSIATTRQAIEHLYASGFSDWHFCLYDDFSSIENSEELDRMAEHYGFEVVHWSEHTNHPSPNYRLTLIDAQKKALDEQADLLIIESDVLVGADTIAHLLAARKEGVGMVASVTHDAEGKVNFPYLFAEKYAPETVDCTKRFSFCCTLLTQALLQTIPFESLNPEKQWFDVTISHMSIENGFKNLLLMQAPVLHLPHSSRPWKQLKYSNPLKYYLLKIFKGRDKI